MTGLDVYSNSRTATAPLAPRLPRRPTTAVTLFVVSLTAFAVLCAVARFQMADVLVYRAEGEAVSQGADLYGFTVTSWRLPATYPPFAALLFVPTGWLSLSALKVVFLAGNVLLLVVLVHLSLRLTNLPHVSRDAARTYARGGGPAVLLVAAAAGLWLEPVYQTITFGQINLVLTCLVLWDLGRPEGARGKGIAVGIAAGIKLTPAIFAVYLLLTGRVRAGLTSIAAFAGTVAVGALVLPTASWEFWTRRIFETTRVGKAWIVDNQSLQGLAARLAHTPDPGLLWLLPAAFVAVAGLLLARRLYVRHGLDGWGVVVTALTALLVSPISWSHHWVWCVPLLALLAVRRPAAALVVYVLFTARTLWLVPKTGTLDLQLSWWAQPLASPYPLLTLALLAAVAVRCYSVSGSEVFSGLREGSGSPDSKSWESTIR
ncbi:glycosyltransferase 87 family protein [Streptomyces albidus (ex Kaewkla and Franco 2022)]|uniref:glycosyltransferase 87 family protein n=1 Tax=Streptomyces albidus (ex Kaewkla and Franco 2022) TaxID=722709 RepID=UPI003AF32C19